MPGKSSDSRVLQGVGLAVAVVAVVGSVALDWEFGRLTDPVPVVVGLVCAALVVGLWYRSR